MKFNLTLLIFFFSFECLASNIIPDKIDPMECEQTKKKLNIEELVIDIEDVKWIKKVGNSQVDSKRLLQFYKKKGSNLLSDRYMPISHKFKKWQKVAAKFKYKNGLICKGNGKIRITGDFSDHYHPQLPLTSFALKLSDFAIYNNTRFKVLLPKTRNGANEVFLTTFLSHLGFLSPETRLVRVKFGKISSLIMIFQEDINKEFIEKNKYVEGPIVEANENIKIGFFDNEKYLNKYPLFDVRFALPKIKNSKWSFRSNENYKDSLVAMNSLNNVFFENIERHIKSGNTKSRYNIQGNFNLLNRQNNSKFKVLDCVEKALQLSHASILSNRIFYYDIYQDSIEPIIYDFNFSGNSFNEEKRKRILSDQSNSYCRKNYLEILENKINLINKKQLYSDLKNKNINALGFYDSKRVGEEIIKNIIFIKQNSINGQLNKFQSSYNFSKDFFYKEGYKDSDTKIVYSINNNFDKYLVCFKKCKIQEFSKNQIKKLLDGKLFINNSYYQLISLHSRNYKKIKINKNLYFYAIGNFEILELKNNNLTFETNDPFAKILFKNQDIEDLNISFKLKKNLPGATTSETLNNFRGCLNFYNVTLNNVKMNVKDCLLEDSVNVVKSNGSINKLKIVNTASDAFDGDFSNLIITEAFVENAKNDCLDFSYGKYHIYKLKLNGCGDKGISAGEQSILKIKNGLIRNSLIGLVSKDEAKLSIEKKINVLNSTICYEEYRKKTEFSMGKILKKKNIKCNRN